ncbi:MAG: energy transducer TonB [Pyrinomonadaceae bacterium]
MLLRLCNLSISKRGLKLSVLACLFAFAVLTKVQGQPVRVAVLDFGASQTGARAAATLRRAFVDNPEPARNFVVFDSDLSAAAARGWGFQGSLNLTTQDARDLGAAIGCDFFIIGDAQTLRRVPSEGAAYFESYASVFVVSARTGRLVFWERPLERRDTAEEAEQALLRVLASADTHHRYRTAIGTALENERAARERAVEKPPPVIDVMADDENGENKSVRAPRPYRRVKPPYPEPAARAEVEAVVDVLVDIDARGEVEQIEIARWAGYGLDQSVIDTVKQMHFFPALRDGVKIPMRVLLRYNFRKPPK